jgi:cob(I)alamin adenosyltransferase
MDRKSELYAKYDQLLARVNFAKTPEERCSIVDQLQEIAEELFEMDVIYSEEE